MNIPKLNYVKLFLQRENPLEIRRVAASLLVCLSIMSGCSKSRGTLEFVPDPVPNLLTQELLVATSRAPLAETPFFSSQRSSATHFNSVAVSVPVDRRAGEVRYPGQTGPDPKKHFLIASHERLSGEAEFIRSINQQASQLQSGSRQGAVLVHGYNINYAEAVVGSAKFVYDLNHPGVNILYSWPSAAKVTKYLLDRETALFARRSLAQTFAATSRSSLNGYIVAGHSMGTFLVMETLRSLVLAKDHATLSKIDAVILVSADLDIGVFIEQSKPVLDAGIPIFVVVAEDDKALSLSVLLRGDERRVGAVRSASDLGDIQVAIIDLSDIQEGRALAHSKAAESELFLSYVSALNEQGVNLFGEQGQPGLFTRGVLFAQTGSDLLIAQ